MEWALWQTCCYSRDHLWHTVTNVSVTFHCWNLTSISPISANMSDLILIDANGRCQSSQLKLSRQGDNHPPICAKLLTTNKDGRKDGTTHSNLPTPRNALTLSFQSYLWASIDLLPLVEVWLPGPSSTYYYDASTIHIFSAPTPYEKA